MRRWHKPPYFLAKLAKPRWVSWSIINMLPMMGQPRGPGGYGGLRRREMRPMKMKRVTTMRRAVVGSDTLLSVCDIEDSIVEFLDYIFLLFAEMIFFWLWNGLGGRVRHFGM